MRLTPLALSLLILAAPAYADKRPDWVDGASGKYPRQAYLIGVGLADDRATAEERARGEVSKIFSTLVTVKTDLTETETNAKGAGGEVAQNTQSIAQSVQSVSKKVLEGVDVVERWKDEATAQHYALAVLERSKAARVVRDKLGEIDKSSLEWKQQMETAAERLPRVKAAMKLLSVLNARGELNNDLRVIEDSGQGLAGPFEEPPVRAAAAKTLGELDVVVDFSGGKSDQVETGVIKGLNGFGLQAKPTLGGDGADILVEGKVETTPLDGDGTPWKWARSSVTVSLKDGRSAKVFLQFDASDRQASRQYPEAARRSQASLAEKVATEVRTAIASYFENQ